MKNFDNNIEMFDAYLDNRMSGDEKAEFEALLGSDKKLKQEFKDYKEIMFALQSSCSDADKEFEEALKGISDEDMKNIVSSKKEQGTQTQLFAEEKPKGKVVPLKTVYRWVSAAAAVLLVVGVGTHLFLGRQPKNGINTDLVCDNVVKDCQYIKISGNPRADISPEKLADQKKDIEKYNNAMELLNSNKTDQAIVILEQLCKKDSTEDRVKSYCPISLANAYLKNHDLKNALRVINDLRKAQSENIEKLTSMNKSNTDDVKEISKVIEKTNKTLVKLSELEDKFITELSNELNKK